jgi:cell division protein FtsI/penicillin-binding protein 2
VSKIMTEEAQKRELSNRRHFSFRLNIFFFVTFFVFSLLIVRLAYLQFVEGDSLKAQEHNIGTRSVSVPPIRGNIYDSSGNPIAFSNSTQSLYFTFDTKMKEAAGRDLAARLVGEFNRLGDKSQKPLTAEDVFDDMDFKGKVYYPYQPRRIKSGLTKEEVAFFSENRAEFSGIEVVEESIRQYSKDQIAVQMVGYLKKFDGAKDLMKYKEMEKNLTDPTLVYLSSEEVGFDGLELMYQDELRGYNGVKEYPVNKDSQIIGPMKLTKPIKGDNLYLTINSKVQQTAQQAITDQIQQIRTSPNEFQKDSHPTTGYAVAMEVKTGKVIAMASMPDYDPSLWQGGISEKDWDSVQYSMSNGTIRDVQPPYADEKERGIHPSSFVNLGSTQKPLTVLVGLSEKLITPSSTFQDKGYFAFGRKGHETQVYNASRTANGTLTPTKAIAKSSNAFMAKMIGNALYLRDGSEGVDIWDGYMKQFGLGVTTGSGLPNESKGKTNYYEEIKAGSAQSALIYAAFGQQAKYSTMQLAQYAATLASHGKRMKPQFVNEIKDSGGNLVQPYQSEVLNTITFPDSYWKTIEDGMALVKVQGFDDFGYNFYRKTGTSQQDVGSRKKVENAVFIAYAPAEDPVLAVAVVVPDGGYGGWGAAPIARKIFDAYDGEIGLTGTPHKQAISTDQVNGAAADSLNVNAANQ